MNNGLIFLLILLLIIIGSCFYQEQYREGFVIEGVQKLVGRHIRNKYRPLRRNLKRHQKKLSEDFGIMFKKMTRK